VKKENKKLKYNIIVVTLMTLVLMLVGLLIGDILFSVIASIPMGAEKEEALSNYLPFVGVIGVVVLFSGLTDVEILKKYFKCSGKKAPIMVAFGLLIGLAMNVICVLPAIISGNLQLQSGNMTAAWGVITLLAVFIQASAEELLSRGYMFQYLYKRYGLVIAGVVSSVFFAVMHIFNDGVTVLALVNIVLIGLFYTSSVVCLDNLWFAMAAHAGWNFCQSFIIGLPNSGIPATLSFWSIQNVQQGMFYDTKFGVESTIVTAIVYLIGIVTLLIIKRKRCLNMPI